jgi:hypothetical protein
MNTLPITPLNTIFYKNMGEGGYQPHKQKKAGISPGLFRFHKP